MIVVHNRFQRVLKILMRLLEVAVLVGAADGTVVKELQGELDGHAVVLAEVGPVLLDDAQHFVDLALGIRPLGLLAQLLGLKVGSGGRGAKREGGLG